MRHDDRVEVRCGTPDDQGAEGAAGDQGAGGPEQFLWRGRLWKVRAVLARRSGDQARERELWRVRAGRGGLESDAVFDLSLDRSDGSWLLAPVALVGAQD